jgi:membrane dipeptidase
MAEIQPQVRAAATSREQLKRFTIVDLHHDIAEDVIARRQRGETDIFRRIWIPRLRSGGIKVQVFPIFLDSAFLPEMALRREMAMIHYLLDEIERNSEEMILVRSYKDLDHALSTTKIAAILALEGAEAIDQDLTVLGILHRLGIRIGSLTWNRRTMFADGAGESGGLTRLGMDLVRAMQELRIIVDVSHLSEQSFWSVIELSQQPIVATHSNARSVCDHPRNLTDAQLKAVAKSGGVIGILIHPGVIDPEHASIERVIDHISHIANAIGIDHLALGADFIADLGGIDQTPAREWLMCNETALSSIAGLSQTTEVPNIIPAMLERGFDEASIQKVLGGNACRVFARAWS